MVRQQIKICVIGAGASGLTSIKQCSDARFSVTCYEKTDFIGGLWHYNDNDQEGIASVMKSTIINSSKEMSCFSDFPPDENLPNFMHNVNMCKYLEAYAKEFDLTQHIKFNHEVIKVTQSADYDLTGDWIVQVRDLFSNQDSEITFNGVMVCNGHHVLPRVPEFQGQEDFGGKIIHSHSFKKPDDSYVDKSVLIIGNGNSGADVAVDLSSFCSRTFLSTRNGVWICPRVGKDGWPGDVLSRTRYYHNLNKLLPSWIQDKLYEYNMHWHFDHELYNLKPNHRSTSQSIMLVNDILPNKILSGSVVIKNQISRFTKNGVIFDGEDEETAIDSVILATGYLIKFPFLSDDIIDCSSDNINPMNDLYKYVFPVKLKHATLAIIGLIQPIGSLFPIAESHARWFCQIMMKNVYLPPLEIMIKDIEDKKLARKRRYYQGENTIQIDWLPHMDEVNEEFGAKPDLWFYFFHDFQLWRHLFFGPAVAAHYRLNGPSTWRGARDTILTAKERVMIPLNTRGLIENLDKKRRNDFLFYLIKIIIYLFIVYAVITTIIF